MQFSGSCNCSCGCSCSCSFCCSCLSIYPSIHPSSSIYLSIYRSVYLQAWKCSYFATLPQFLNLTTSKTKQFCKTSSILELDNIKNEASLRGFLNFWTWQRQKRSNSARLPHFFKLPTSKTKQFCETSFKNGKLSAELTASYQCVLRFFQSICLNYKKWCQVIRSAAPVTQNHLSKPEDLMLQNATPLRKSAP